ncbi:hypothetical protein CPC08DRAFT_770604 [Agrocybe pediades]|nr:hypothetical protein CPC08DRAFT_770604 [Agrocybe pediades]
MFCDSATDATNWDKSSTGCPLMPLRVGVFNSTLLVVADIGLLVFVWKKAECSEHSQANDRAFLLLSLTCTVWPLMATTSSWVLIFSHFSANVPLLIALFNLMSAVAIISANLSLLPAIIRCRVRNRVESYGLSDRSAYESEGRAEYTAQSANHNPDAASLSGQKTVVDNSLNTDSLQGVVVRVASDTVLRDDNAFRANRQI